eukprot:TRINITY_DN4226_c0_g2_i1.p1 TRINITY_DN4226_c0_g2~~TRINITY_DN4226_c0_g2_i1.p1  ORF type:complete len:183 (+),score=58.33 TRINITY_DN4226_c0_g2_i1:314-862(+)
MSYPPNQIVTSSSINSSSSATDTDDAFVYDMYVKCEDDEEIQKHTISSNNSSREAVTNNSNINNNNNNATVHNSNSNSNSSVHTLTTRSDTRRDPMNLSMLPPSSASSSSSKMSANTGFVELSSPLLSGEMYDYPFQEVDSDCADDEDDSNDESAPQNEYPEDARDQQYRKMPDATIDDDDD